MLDNIAMAFQSLRTNKMRAFLTMLGIIIGIGAVIAIKTVGNSLTGSITDSMSSFGASNISLSLSQKSSDDEEDSFVNIRIFMDNNPSEEDLITDAMLTEYKETFPEEVAYIETTESVGTITVDNTVDSDTTSVMVTGINDEYIEAEEVTILSGRSIQNEKDADRKVCVVSDRFLEDCLGIGSVNAIGQEITLSINNVPYIFYIEGVYEYSEDSSLTMVSSDTSDVTTNLYIPLSTAKILTGSSSGYQSVTVMTKNGTDTTTFMDTTESFFDSFYTYNDSWTITASSLESVISTMTDILDTVSLAISAIAAISLLVGGIGVMNIMLVSVTERTREIGTRKALGAPRSAIRIQFIVEAVIICLTGGMIGIALGTGLGAVICKVMGYAARASFSTIMIVVAISMAIGIFFGYYPANKAAKLDPIEALRYE